MLSRRHFLGTAAASLVAAPAIVRAQTLWRHYPFSLGVASGDPSPDGFVIWTRLAPEPLEPHGGMGMGVMPVNWVVASDDRFRNIIAKGQAPARPELAHTVHVEVAGLQPDRPYYYRFEAGGEESIRGRARTLPLASATPQQLRFGVAGCQAYEDGYYTAYRHLAGEDLAFVFHYGDYIYEYRGDPIGAGWNGELSVPVRQHAGEMLMSLDDYRRRHAQYKTDPDLQRAHAAHPFFVTYDDHEIDNNWAADIEEDGVPPEIFRFRRAAAFQAWYEHMPVRRAQLPCGSAIRMYRSAHFGNLAEIDFLDTRQYRSNQPCNDRWGAICPEIEAPNATMLGKEQEDWLVRNLRRDARWNVVAQQVMMMSLDRREKPDEAPHKMLNLDSWAGYAVPRERLLARMRGLDNVVVLTGDEHQNFAGLLHDRDKPVAVEFVSTSISSGGDGQDVRPGSDTILANNPQLKFINDQRGYLTCDVTPDEFRTNFMVVDKVSAPNGELSKRATLAVPRGEPSLHQA